MSLSLRLLPFDHDEAVDAYSHTVLSCDQDPELFEEIQRLPAHPAPPDFRGYTSRHGYGVIKETAYGDELMYVIARALHSLEPRVNTPRNNAVWAYLESLQPLTKVALDWH